MGFPKIFPKIWVFCSKWIFSVKVSIESCVSAEAYSEAIWKVPSHPNLLIGLKFEKIFIVMIMKLLFLRTQWLNFASKFYRKLLDLTSRFEYYPSESRWAESAKMCKLSLLFSISKIAFSEKPGSFHFRRPGLGPGAICL